MKIHDIKNVIIDNMTYSYFYIREKNDRNGNPRYRVYIIDPDAPAVYEVIARTYSNIETFVINFIEEAKQN